MLKEKEDIPKNAKNLPYFNLPSISYQLEPLMIIISILYWFSE